MDSSADLFDRYHVLEELGSGSFGVVYKAFDRETGETVAIKLIDLESSDDDIQDIQQEIAVLSTCNSPFVTQYRASYLRGHKIWIVMEYLGGGSCLDLLRSGALQENQIAIVCREILLGLNYLHQEGKIHRDVKAANILLAESGRVKLADFGVAAQLTNIQSQRNTFVGTPFWMAPEVIQQAGYDFKADIWSLGITAMELIHGEPPHAHAHPMKVLFTIPKAPAPRLDGHGYGTDFRNFVAACLVKDPDRRPTAKELLQHRFIRSAGRLDCLKELIRNRQTMGSSSGELKPPKYYEETLRPLVIPDICDDFVFDTVKVQAHLTDGRTQGSTEEIKVLDYAQDSMETMISQLTLGQPPTAAKTSSSTVRCVHTMKRKLSSVAIGLPAKRASSAQRQPLAPSTSYGNSPSSRRQFRRVPDNSHDLRSNSSDTLADENRPQMPEISSKELLGQRTYSKAIDQAFQESCAHTVDQDQREAIFQVARAWKTLNRADPNGEYSLLKILIAKVHADPTLASLIPESLQSTSTKPKLVLAQSNPHLESHRRRQSSLLSTEDPLSNFKEYLPGRCMAGMEHEKDLANALYSKWIEGLTNRWPCL